MADYMKKPCTHCPFRSDIKPFLHPERAYEIAAAALNPYISFSCHKTTECDDGDSGEMVVTEHSKECAGFLTLRAQSGEDVPDGFEPSWEICYEDAWEMADAYQEEWDKTHRKEVSNV